MSGGFLAALKDTRLLQESSEVTECAFQMGQETQLPLPAFP